MNEWGAIRLPGVVQRIGIVFFFAALLFLHCEWRELLSMCVGLLLADWIWMGFIQMMDESPTFERAPNNWANYIDLNVLGTHMYKPDYDPEGILSTIPSIATSLLGIFTGLLLRSARKDKVRMMIVMGVALLFLGYLWNMVFPINKALWTSSYVLVTAGWGNLFLALIYYLTDVKEIQFGSIFRHAGANAITIYFLSSFVTKLFYLIRVDDTNTVHGWLFDTLYVQDFMSLEFSSMLYGLSVAGFYCLLAYVMYKKGIFIKV